MNIDSSNNQIVFNRTRFLSVSFVIYSFLLALLLDYGSIFSMRPKSWHVWRQCDGASLARNYYQDDISFFEPQLHHLMGGNGKTVGEFPIIYYITSKIYKVLGFNEGYFRVFNFLIFYVGIFYLFRLGLYITNDVIISSCIATLAWVSPIVAFYSFNFLPNAPALGLCYAALYFCYRFYKTRQKSHYYCSLVFICFSALLKVTVLVPIFAFIACLVLAEINRQLNWIKTDFKTIKWTYFLGYLLSLAPLATWLKYASYYKEINDNWYFGLRPFPLYKASEKTLKLVRERMFQDWGWWPTIHLEYFIYLAGLVLLLTLIVKGIKSRLYFIILLVGYVFYVLLFGKQFDHHDYYIIDLIPILILPFLGLAKDLQNKYLTRLFQVSIVVLTVLSIFHCRSQLHKKYYLENHDKLFYVLHDIEPLLDKAGIEKDAKIFVIGDRTVNVSLYFMNRKGWCQNIAYPKQLEQAKEWGLDYIVFMDTNVQKDEKYVKFLGEKKAKIKGIPFYKVK